VTGLDSGAADPEIKKWGSRGYLLKNSPIFTQFIKHFPGSEGFHQMNTILRH
jgi:hypothetical protein